MIHTLYLEGYSTKQITKVFESKGISTIRGNKKWNHTVIEKMLANEKYTGVILL